MGKIASQRMHICAPLVDAEYLPTVVALVDNSNAGKFQLPAPTATWSLMVSAILALMMVCCVIVL